MKEKEFMKMWNSFMFPISLKQNDKDMPSACVQFAKSMKADIHRSNLRNIFLIHLCHLWDWGLIDKNDVTNSMTILDKSN